MPVRRRLELEELGERTLPSITPIILPFIPAPTVVVQHHLSLEGKGDGTFTAGSLIVDSGVNYTLQGTANLRGMGEVTVTGTVDGVGLVRHGHATGTLTFTNSKGSVTVSLEGPEQKFFSPLPHNFQFKVVGATGDYQNMTDQGSLQLHFQLASPPPPVAGQGIPLGHGTFTLNT